MANFATTRLLLQKSSGWEEVLAVKHDSWSLPCSRSGLLPASLWRLLWLLRPPAHPPLLRLLPAAQHRAGGHARLRCSFRSVPRLDQQKPESQKAICSDVSKAKTARSALSSFYLQVSERRACLTFLPHRRPTADPALDLAPSPTIPFSRDPASTHSQRQTYSMLTLSRIPEKRWTMQKKFWRD